MIERARSRPRLAAYWASACGGCQATFLDLGERLLEIEEQYEIVLFPLLMDGKTGDLDSIEPGGIDLCLISGAVRTAHDSAMVTRLRELSSVLVALGACAHLGSVLGLANTDTAGALLETVYGPGGPFPTGVRTPLGNTLPLAPLEPSLRPLEELVTVDYVIPGCPPERETLWTALTILAGIRNGEVEPPPPGSVLGASDLALCEECPRDNPTGPVSRFFRAHQVDPDPHRCLLDQGLICMGPATRGGCGAACIAAGAACHGCYGPLDGAMDQGARMLGALIAVAGPRSFDEAESARETDLLVESIPDLLGTLYRYSFARSLLGRFTPWKGAPPCDE